MSFNFVRWEPVWERRLQALDNVILAMHQARLE
jgi:hypothetical protein